MNLTEEYTRITGRLEWVKSRIAKVRAIMNWPDQHLESDSIKAYREKVLRELTLYQQQLEFELEDLIDDIRLERADICLLIYGHSP